MRDVGARHILTFVFQTLRGFLSDFLGISIYRAERGLAMRQSLEEQVFIKCAHISSFTASSIQRCRCMMECSEFTPQEGSTTKGPGT